MKIETGKFRSMKGAYLEKIVPTGGPKVTGFAGRHCSLL